MQSNFRNHTLIFGVACNLYNNVGIVLIQQPTINGFYDEVATNIYLNYIHSVVKYMAGSNTGKSAEKHIHLIVVFY